MLLFALVLTALFASVVVGQKTEPPSLFRCSPDQFRCKAEKCIAKQWKCDGEDDCGDYSDETDCPARVCLSSEFTCRNSRCIPMSSVCDEMDDCGDKSDETKAACNSTGPRTCEPMQYQCNNSKCIPEKFKCDGDDDCDDKEDESNCGPKTCAASEFTCDNGGCISARWKCDGDPDCTDGSDEVSCGRTTCGSKFVKCGDGHCVPNKWKCDGDADCTDGADEVSCNITTKAPATCPPELWLCDRSLCILNGWKCDGEEDCIDKTDEENCDRVTCPSTKLPCASGRECFMKSQRCNKVEDCSDGSDENNCPTPTLLCTARHFNCSTGTKCIEQSKVCDNVRDCPDGDDEPTNCFINECIDSNGHCMHKCHDMKIGFRCSCNPGFKVAADGHSCDDVNECAEYGKCHQLCLNRKGSYKCSCANGYILENNHRICKAGGDVRPRLIFASRFDIRSFRIDGSDYRLVAGGLKGAVGLDFDYANNYVYWTDVAHETIHRARIDRYSSSEILIRDLHTPDGISVDWIGRKLYWSDGGLKKIEVAELDGSNNMELLTVAGQSQPRAIVVDPNEGYVYWTDWGREPGIERISMDGDATTRQHLISTNVVWPNALTLDYAQNKMYWMDAKLGRLEVANMDGSDRLLLILSNLDSPFSMTNFEDKIYWTSWRKNEIKIASKFNEANIVKRVSSNHISPLGIKVFHPLQQPSGINPCGNNNGGCSHLCLIARKSSGRGFSCKCPRGMYIQADGKKCSGVPVTRKPRPTVYRTTPNVRTTAESVQSTAHKGTNPKTSGSAVTSIPKSVTNKHTKATEIPHVKNPEKSSKEQDSTSASVGLVIGITLSLLVICLGIGAGIWYYRTRQQGLHSIMYYKDMSTAPLEEDFDGDNDDDKGKISVDYQGV